MKVKWIKYHLLFFFITWTFNFIFNFYHAIPDGKSIPYSVFFMVDNIFLICYFYAVVLLSPLIFTKMKYFIPFHLLLMITGCFILAVFPYCFYNYIGESLSFSRGYFIKMFDVAYMSFSGLGFLFLQKYDESTTQKLKLLESLSEAELTFLRSQMSPHFLLNVLNSIYSLALNKSPEVYPAISQLKIIYTYVRRSQGKVLLKDEIEYLRNFINIQKRRFGNSVVVEVDFDIDTDYMIEPLLLSTFVENAFKHGISGKATSHIRIKLRAREGVLNYEVYNCDHSFKNKDATSGIGLKNLMRRLELLYHDSYSLINKSENGIYSSVLTIRKL